MDRLAGMAVFVRVAELGSFAAAADDLGMSAQMVAKHVMSIEARLGVRLLNRTTRRHSLTEIGGSYLGRCRLVLAEAEAADALARQAVAEPRGRLRISAPVSFGTHRLTPLVTRFLRRHPKVEIDLVLNDRFVDLVEDGFEAVFRIGPLTDSSLVALPLAPFRLVVCAAPAYLRERGTPLRPADLASHECVGFTHWPTPTADEWHFVRDGQSYAVRIRNQLRVNNARALLAAASGGFGIVLIALDLVREALANGGLERVLPAFETPSRPMHLLHLADRRQTPKLKRFIEAVVQEFGA